LNYDLEAEFNVPLLAMFKQRSKHPSTHAADWRYGDGVASKLKEKLFGKPNSGCVRMTMAVDLHGAHDSRFTFTQHFLYSRDDSLKLTSLLRAKIEQQIELAVGWWRSCLRITRMAPAPDAFQLGDLLGHMLEACAGSAPRSNKFKPQELAHFTRLRDLPVNHRCGIEEASARLRDYRQHIGEGFAVLTDADLARRVADCVCSDRRSFANDSALKP